jgi:hypothetical protein
MENPTASESLCSPTGIPKAESKIFLRLIFLTSEDDIVACRYFNGVRTGRHLYFKTSGGGFLHEYDREVTQSRTALINDEKALFQESSKEHDTLSSRD